MSSIRRYNKDSEVSEISTAVEVPDDYVPKHPMLKFKGPKKVVTRDHLDEYNEVTPFEDSEGLMSGLKWLGDKAKKAAKSISKHASKAYESGKKMLSGEKDKEAEDKEDKEEEEAEEAAPAEEEAAE